MVVYQDGIKAVWLDRVEVVDYYDKFIRTTRSPLQLPSVVRLKRYVKNFIKVRSRPDKAV